ncbi:flagellin N-methylase [mine drainage metagenome]|uniref:Flagellin N-methylase n=1 Tax=mine drainage metagenome TaxID=410659 RepID=A0A1J5P708_9ZZZZ
MPTTIPIHSDSPLPQSVGDGCTRCGKCCTNASYMLTLFATPNDILRWRREGRSDILRYAPVFQEIGSADLWIDPVSGNELSRCPFLKRSRGAGGKYLCSIHETRPDVCRGYPYSMEQMREDGCEIPIAAATN